MAGRKTKNNPLTNEEILDLTKEKHSSKLYKAEVKQLSDEGIKKSVQKALYIVNNVDAIRKVDLGDVEQVKQIVNVYLETCASESAIPSMSEIALCLGCTRQSLYWYMKNKKHEPTGRFLIQVHDLIASTLADNALRGNVNNIVAIFVLKSMYGIREDDNTTDSQQLVDDFEQSSDGYKQKYRKLIGLEE